MLEDNMKKASLLIKGNLQCKNILRGGGGNFVFLAKESDYDLSECVIIEGDLITDDDISAHGLVLVTGFINITGGK